MVIFIEKIIAELQNGKAIDIPVHVIKRSSKIISPILSYLINYNMGNGIALTSARFCARARRRFSPISRIREMHLVR